MKLSKKLLLFGLIAATGGLSAVKDTQKTELMLRDHRHRAAAFTTYHQLRARHTKKFGTKFQINAFYNETCDSGSLGEVFGTCGRNSIRVGTKSQVDSGSADVENRLLLHYSEPSPEINTLAGTIKFNPKHTAFGTQFEASIRLDKWIKGLYLKEYLVFYKAKNDINMTVCNSETGAAPTESHSLCDILSGKRLQRNLSSILLSRENYQEELRYAKIRGSESRTGIGNMETALCWRFLEKKRYYIGIDVALECPSGDRPTGEYLWEPRLGSQHWGLGCGLEAGVTLWKNKKNSFKLLGEFNYNYQFEETEKRTLGIKNVLTATNHCKHVLSHYYQLVEKGQYTFIPAANVLTKDVDVTPGSQIDTFAALNLNLGNFVFDLGYNFFWKDREEVSLDSCKWCNDKYGIADREVLACGNPFTIGDALPENVAINYCNVDTSVAETPSMMTHTIFGGMGYIFKKWKNPLMLGLGGSYEFGGDRGAADSWMAWLKAGFSF